MTDDWMDGLRSSADGVRPVGDMVEPVRAGVRRRQRRRAGVTAAAAATLVVVAMAAVAAWPGPSDQRDAPPPPTATDDTETAFTCPLGDGGFHNPQPIPDLAGQQRLVDLLATISSVRVHHAAPSALGVVALVDDDTGDRDHLAQPDVVDRLKRLGVAYVYEWDPDIAGSGVDAAGQVQQVVLWQLDAATREVRAATKGVPGSAGLVLWPEGGAIVLQWKAPLPPEVAALDGATYGGVRVIVHPVTYSNADVRAAQHRLEAWLAANAHDDWSTVEACADNSGLVVGMVPPVEDAEGLAAQMSRAAGVPVKVIGQSRPVPAVG